MATLLVAQIADTSLLKTSSGVQLPALRNLPQGSETVSRENLCRRSFPSISLSGGVQYGYFYLVEKHRAGLFPGFPFPVA